MLPALLLALASQAASPAPASAAGGDPEAAAPFRVERGPGAVPVLVPRDEELTFDVIIDLGVLGDVDVGDVVLSTGVERIARGGLPSARNGDRKVEFMDRAWVRGVATGGYAGYSVREEIEASHTPQEWPAIFYKTTQAGSENRRRELKIGLLDGVLSAGYRSDRHCKSCTDTAHFVDSVWSWGKPYHCDKCKRAEHRVWRDPVSRPVPEGAIDMLSAVYVARAMVEQGVESTELPIVDQQKVWNVRIEQGPHKTVEVPSGRFECAQIILHAAPDKDEDDEDGGKNFKGLFGIQGAIRIWFHAQSGVPVLIQGELPIPVPLVGNLDLSVELKGYKRTPATFVPLPGKK